MLYDLHELQRAFLSPLAAFTSTGSKLFTNPYSPLSYTPLSRQIAAGYELVHRLGKEYEKPAWGLNSTIINGKSVGISEHVAARRPFCNLINFKRENEQGLNNPKVLLVAPLSGHHATLLRATVNELIPDHDVYVTDWIDARMVPVSEGPFHLNDYVTYIQDFIRILGPDLHVMAVCQPTVPVLAAVSLLHTQAESCVPRSLILMGGPVDARKSPTQVNRLATTKSYSWFENNLIERVPVRYPGAGRKVYPGFLQHAGFIAMNPDRHMQSHYDFYLSLLEGDGEDAEAHRRFYDEYNAVLDMPAEFYLDTIKVVFQEYKLAKGSWVIDGVRVNPADIKNTALFTIEGELDDISGQGQTKAAQDLCSSLPKELRKHYVAPKCGHYGIFSGRRWRNLIAPKVKEFIRSNA